MTLLIRFVGRSTGFDAEVREGARREAGWFFGDPEMTWSERINIWSEFVVHGPHELANVGVPIKIQVPPKAHMALIPQNGHGALRS